MTTMNRTLLTGSATSFLTLLLTLKICHPTEFDFFLCSHADIKVKDGWAAECRSTSGSGSNSIILICLVSCVVMIFWICTSDASCINWRRGEVGGLGRELIDVWLLVRDGWPDLLFNLMMDVRCCWSI